MIGAVYPGPGEFKHRVGRFDLIQGSQGSPSCSACCFAVEVFEEIRIDFHAVAGALGEPLGRGDWGRSGRRAWRGTGWGGVPEVAVLEDFFDHVGLAGLDEGDDLHGAAALGAQEGVGVVDAFDEDGPGGGGGFGGRRGQWAGTPRPAWVTENRPNFPLASSPPAS